MEKFKLLIINPGSTSTKIAVYINDKAIFLKTIVHPTSELEKFPKISDQFEYRKSLILDELTKGEIDLSIVKVVMGRGGLIKPIESGVYIVNKNLRRDLVNGVMGQHASNLGGLIAYDIAKSLPDAKAYIADPVVVDELQDVARISGHPEFERVSIFHALNHKAVAKTYADSVNKKYSALNLIVAHMGGGISVGAHKAGKVIDVNQALDGEGPFSPERSGTLPLGKIVEYCFSGKKQIHEIKKMITGKGGFVAYLGTNNAYDVEMMFKQGDNHAKLILNALAYQVAKEIGAMATVLKGKVDVIILTGGLAYNKYIVRYIKDMVSYIAPIKVIPGGDEMKALALNAYMLLKGEIQCKIYE